MTVFLVVLCVVMCLGWVFEYLKRRSFEECVATQMEYIENLRKEAFGDFQEPKKEPVPPSKDDLREGREL